MNFKYIRPAIDKIYHVVEIDGVLCLMGKIFASNKTGDSCKREDKIGFLRINISEETIDELFKFYKIICPYENSEDYKELMEKINERKN